MSTSDRLLERFPHSVLPPIIGLPTYETIHQMHVLLNANAASVESTLGDGQLGLLGLTITTAKYESLSAGNVAFTKPTNPGLNPSIDVTTSTAIQITEANRQHGIQERTWKETVGG